MATVQGKTLSLTLFVLLCSGFNVAAAPAEASYRELAFAPAFPSSSWINPVASGVRPHVVPLKANPLKRYATEQGLWLRASIDGDGEPVSSYQQSSGVVKGVVSGLTSLVNSVMGQKLQETEVEEIKEPVTPAELRDGIEGDYRRLYLWTGDIDPALYDAGCVFTDPTLSFTGLATFQKNLANLRPIIDRLVRKYDVELYSCELDEANKNVKAQWRMLGTLDLPWSPVIDLRGATTFRYEESKGNRIVDYFETWETPAGTVLLNLLKPGGGS